MYEDFDSRYDQSSNGRRHNRTTKPASTMILSKDDNDDDDVLEEEMTIDRCSTTTTSKDAPHCVTCACLSSSKMSCSYQQTTTCFDRCSKGSGFSCPGFLQQPPSCRKYRSENHGSQRLSGRRKSRRNGGSTTIEELLREMNLSSMLASAEELGEISGVENETPRNKDDKSERYHRPRHRCEAGDYYSRRATPKPISDRSRYDEQAADRGWNVKKGEVSGINEEETDNAGRLYDRGDGQQLVAPTIDDLGSDNSGIDDLPDVKEFDRNKWQDEASKSSQEVAHSNKEDSELRCDNSVNAKENEDGEDGEENVSSTEAHVNQLKLVRMEFIERIFDEVGKLRRLQRHLDDCSPRRSSHVTRSVSTMTSARGTPSQSEIKKS